VFRGFPSFAKDLFTNCSDASLKAFDRTKYFQPNQTASSTHIQAGFTIDGKAVYEKCINVEFEKRSNLILTSGKFDTTTDDMFQINRLFYILSCKSGSSIHHDVAPSLYYTATSSEGKVWVAIPFEESLEHKIFSLPGESEKSSTSYALDNWLQCKRLKIIIAKQGDTVTMPVQWLHGTESNK
jgi:hypothetical protein